MQSFFEHWLGAELIDIVVRGVVTTESTPWEFLPFFDVIYLTIAQLTIECRVVEEDCSMTVRVIDGPREDLPFEMEEDHRFCLSSMSQLLLGELHDNRLVEIEVHEGKMDGAVLQCQALEVVLASEDRLFFDPSTLSGIRCGGAEVKKRWEPKGGDITIIKTSES